MSWQLLPMAGQTHGNRYDGSVFVNVQHPGEDGTWDAQQFRVEHGGATRG
jgi:hypothetical protein